MTTSEQQAPVIGINQQTTVREWHKWLSSITKEATFLSKPGPPIRILNEEGKMHNLNGPAYISFTSTSCWVDGRLHGVETTRSGTKTYYWEGIAVPANFVLDRESLTFAEVISQPNAEVRRIGCALYGFDRMKEEGHLTTIDSDPHTGAELLKCERFGEGSEALVLVKVLDSTTHAKQGRKIHFIPVPPYSKSCKDAIAWTFGKDAENYKPQIET